MPPDPNIPDAFDVYALVLLRRPADAPAMSEVELDALQARHLAYRAELRRQGILVVNGPLGEQSDTAMRGLSIFACSLDEAARLSDGDPSVQAGQSSSRHPRSRSRRLGASAGRRSLIPGLQAALFSEAAETLRRPGAPAWPRR